MCEGEKGKREKEERGEETEVHGIKGREMHKRKEENGDEERRSNGRGSEER